MTIDTSLKLNNLPADDYKKSELPTPSKDESNLLSITSRFSKDALMNVERIMSSEDVYTGTVEKEIDKILKEEDQINSILKANTTALNSTAITSLQETLRSSTAKSIGFVQYSGKSKINATTNTTSIKNSIVANNDKEKQLISDSIDTMTAWLDDYIANYNVRVAEGQRNGDSELKLSFLLEVRKAIENCDFVVGFGTVGNNAGDNFTPNDDTMGAYNPSMLIYNDTKKIVGYDTYHLNGPKRNILLNPDYFMPERPYSTLDELKAAVQSGQVTQISRANIGSFLIEDEAYNNYCQTNLAITLWHELIHSTHIYNEYVTYYATDAYEDDVKNKPIEGVSNATANYLKQIFPTLFGDGVTYSSMYVTHGFDNYNQVVDFAWNAIQSNKGAFDLYMPGVTKAQFEAELKNFMATA